MSARFVFAMLAAVAACGRSAGVEPDPLLTPAGCVGCGTSSAPPPSPWATIAPLAGHAGPAAKLLTATNDALENPDACYVPQWRPEANAAFFVPGARPVTQTRFRWDSGSRLTQPDRAEYFWAAAGRKGPRPETGVRYNELSLYAEAGAERFSAFIDTPYRNLRGDVNGGAGGFGDLGIGTKSLLFDSDRFQFAFQFRTNIPTGNAGRGTGVGHVSLEPAFLAACELFPDTVVQNQLAYRIPVGGTNGFAGNVLEFGTSFNRVLARPAPTASVIGTLEFRGFSFLSGSVTDPATGVAKSANGTTYFEVAPGLRLTLAERLDVGVSVNFAATQPRFAQNLVRTELRLRF